MFYIFQLRLTNRLPRDKYKLNFNSENQPGEIWKKYETIYLIR